jgi:hypothetical protein
MMLAYGVSGYFLGEGGAGINIQTILEALGLAALRAGVARARGMPSGHDPRQDTQGCGQGREDISHARAAGQGDARALIGKLRHIREYF